MTRSTLVLVIFFMAATVGLSTGQSTDEFEPYMLLPLGQEAQTAAIGDLNGDGLNDIAVTAWPSAIYVLYQQSDGTAGSPVELSAPQMPLGLAIGDINGDGLADLAAGGTSGQIWLYYQQPDG
ncbi:MAG TPA: VCBS repeat-containing protein, partial [Armatimonadota bacterium]|nr:VCBS repeat-containing protein [Armatimonadota bacterium]